MRETEEMPLLRSALGPTGRPCGDGLHYATASGTGGRKAATTRSWDMAGSTLKKSIRGRRMGVGAVPLRRRLADIVAEQLEPGLGGLVVRAGLGQALPKPG